MCSPVVESSQGDFDLKIIAPSSTIIPEHWKARTSVRHVFLQRAHLWRKRRRFGRAGLERRTCKTTCHYRAWWITKNDNHEPHSVPRDVETVPLTVVTSPGEETIMVRWKRTGNGSVAWGYNEFAFEQTRLLSLLHTDAS